MENSIINKPLREVDPEIDKVINLELIRQRQTLEMIASENFAPRAILEAQGSILTNKYAEGYPGRRYYGGCKYVDIIENLAIKRAKDLFNAEFVNVQPHSGSTANAAVLSALINPGDKIMGLSLSHGGHLTHGMKLNYSGKLYKTAFYGVDSDSYLIDMNQVRDKALKEKPQIIIAGWSAYSRKLDFEAFRSIADEVNAKLWTDMAHFAGLVAAGLHPSPFPHSDIVTSTVHKTIAGPRSGIILCKDEYSDKINSSVFPGQQGGPLMHAIAAKATAFKIAKTEEYKECQKRTLEGAKIIADFLMSYDVKKNGIEVLTGGTDVHLVLVDLKKSSFNGMQAEALLHKIGITVNRNAVPFDKEPPFITSGLRIGTSALATRGFGKEEFSEVADIIVKAFLGYDILSLKDRVLRLTNSFPLYSNIENW